MNKGTGAPDEEKLPHKLAWGGRGAGEGKGLFQEPASQGPKGKVELTVSEGI